MFSEERFSEKGILHEQQEGILLSAGSSRTGPALLSSSPWHASRTTSPTAGFNSYTNTVFAGCNATALGAANRGLGVMTSTADVENSIVAFGTSSTRGSAASLSWNGSRPLSPQASPGGLGFRGGLFGGSASRDVSDVTNLRNDYQLSSTKTHESLMPLAALTVRERELETRAMTRKRHFGTLATSWLVRNCFAEWRTLVQLRIVVVAREKERVAKRMEETSVLQQVEELQRIIAQKQAQIRDLELRVQTFIAQEGQRCFGVRRVVHGISDARQNIEATLLCHWAFTSFQLAAHEYRSSRQLLELEARCGERVVELEAQHRIAVAKLEQQVAQLHIDWEKRLKSLDIEYASRESDWQFQIQQAEHRRRSGTRAFSSMAIDGRTRFYYQRTISLVFQAWRQLHKEFRKDEEWTTRNANERVAMEKEWESRLKAELARCDEVENRLRAEITRLEMDCDSRLKLEQANTSTLQTEHASARKEWESLSRTQLAGCEREWEHRLKTELGALDKEWDAKMRRECLRLEQDLELKRKTDVLDLERELQKQRSDLEADCAEKLRVERSTVEQVWEMKLRDLESQRLADRTTLKQDAELQSQRIETQWQEKLREYSSDADLRLQSMESEWQAKMRRLERDYEVKWRQAEIETEDKLRRAERESEVNLRQVESEWEANLNQIKREREAKLLDTESSWEAKFNRAAREWELQREQVESDWASRFSSESQRLAVVLRSKHTEFAQSRWNTIGQHMVFKCFSLWVQHWRLASQILRHEKEKKIYETDMDRMLKQLHEANENHSLARDKWQQEQIKLRAEKIRCVYSAFAFSARDWQTSMSLYLLAWKTLCHKSIWESRLRELNHTHNASLERAQQDFSSRETDWQRQFRELEFEWRQHKLHTNSLEEEWSQKHLHLLGIVRARGVYASALSSRERNRKILSVCLFTWIRFSELQAQERNHERRMQMSLLESRTTMQRLEQELASQLRCSEEVHHTRRLHEAELRRSIECEAEKRSRRLCRFGDASHKLLDSVQRSFDLINLFLCWKSDWEQARWQRMLQNSLDDASRTSSKRHSFMLLRRDLLLDNLTHTFRLRMHMKELLALWFHASQVQRWQKLVGGVKTGVWNWSCVALRNYERLILLQTFGAWWRALTAKTSYDALVEVERLRAWQRECTRRLKYKLAESPALWRSKLILARVLAEWNYSIQHASHMGSIDSLSMQLLVARGRQDLVTHKALISVQRDASSRFLLAVFGAWRNYVAFDRRRRRRETQLESWGAKYGEARGSVLWHRILVLWRLRTKLEVWQKKLARMSRGNLRSFADRVMQMYSDCLALAFLRWCAVVRLRHQQLAIDGLGNQRAGLRLHSASRRDHLMMLLSSKHGTCLQLAAFSQWWQATSAACGHREREVRREESQRLRQLGYSARHRVAQKVWTSQVRLLLFAVITAWRQRRVDIGNFQHLSSLHGKLRAVKYRAAERMSQAFLGTLTCAYSAWWHYVLESRSLRQQAKALELDRGLAHARKEHEDFRVIVFIKDVFKRWSHFTVVVHNLRAIETLRFSNRKTSGLDVLVAKMEEQRLWLSKWEVFTRWRLISQKQHVEQPKPIQILRDSSPRIAPRPAYTVVNPSVTYAMPAVSQPTAYSVVTRTAPVFSPRQVSLFDVIDRNHDGVITRDEFVQACVGEAAPLRLQRTPLQRDHFNAWRDTVLSTVAPPRQSAVVAPLRQNVLAAPPRQTNSVLVERRLERDSARRADKSPVPVLCESVKSFATLSPGVSSTMTLAPAPIVSPRTVEEPSASPVASAHSITGLRTKAMALGAQPQTVLSEPVVGALGSWTQSTSPRCERTQATTSAPVASVLSTWAQSASPQSEQTKATLSVPVANALGSWAPSASPHSERMQACGSSNVLPLGGCGGGQQVGVPQLTPPRSRLAGQTTPIPAAPPQMPLSSDEQAAIEQAQAVSPQATPQRPVQVSPAPRAVVKAVVPRTLQEPTSMSLAGLRLGSRT